MLRFFRQLRRRMLPESRFSKYLMYAIGEIMLVVLGILIALQIDNWNEGNRSRIAISEALMEVREDLVIDTLHLAGVIKVRSEDLISQRRIIGVLGERRAFTDQTYRDLGRVMLQRQTKLLTNGYDLLNELGIRKLNNKELRNNLLEYYEWVHSWIGKELDDDTYEFESTWLPYVRENFSEWVFGEIGIPLSDTDLMADSYLLISLKMNEKNLNASLEAHLYALKRAKALIQMIDNLQN